MIKKKRLVYIDQLVGPTSLDIINALTKHYEVHLYYGGIIKTYADINSSVKLFKRVAYSKKNFYSRLFSWMAFYLTTLPFVLIRKKEALFLVSNPPLNFFVGYVFNRLWRIPYCLLLWDIYPDIIVQSGYISKGSVIARFWSDWNTKTFPKAYRIFTVSENLSKEIKKYVSNDMANVTIVPNWVNSDQIKPIPRNENVFLKRYKLENLFVVMYSGNLGKTHDLETILETARLLKENQNIRFLIIGDGEKKAKITRMIADGQLMNVNLLPSQDAEMFKSSITAAHIGFVTLSQGFENFSVPSKTYYLMAAGSIVFAIANGGSELENLINQYEFGYRFDPGNAGEIAQKILTIYNDDKLMRELRENARAAAGHFTIENANIIAREVSQS